jgi:hypothetical protein
LPGAARALRAAVTILSESLMGAILPIALFIVAVIAINVFEFGRPD